MCGILNTRRKEEGNKMANLDKTVNQVICEYRSECCEALPTSQVSFDHSDDLGSRWVSYCSDCEAIADFSCYEHMGCNGENSYPISTDYIATGHYAQIVKPEFS